MVFANNDVPGVMLASAAMSYAVQYAVRPGKRVVVVTSCDSAYEAAEALRVRGVTLVAIVDTRFEPGSVAVLGEGSWDPCAERSCARACTAAREQCGRLRYARSRTMMRRSGVPVR